MRTLFVLAAFALFLLTFSFRMTSGRAFTKLEVGYFAGPWLTWTDRAGKTATTLDPRAGSAICGYSLLGLAVVHRLTRKRAATTVVPA